MLTIMMSYFVQFCFFFLSGCEMDLLAMLAGFPLSGALREALHKVPFVSCFSIETDMIDYCVKLPASHF